MNKQWNLSWRNLNSKFETIVILSCWKTSPKHPLLLPNSASFAIYTWLYCIAPVISSYHLLCSLLGCQLNARNRSPILTLTLIPTTTYTHTVNTGADSFAWTRSISLQSTGLYFYSQSWTNIITETVLFPISYQMLPRSVMAWFHSRTTQLMSMQAPDISQ